MQNYEMMNFKLKIKFIFTKQMLLVIAVCLLAQWSKYVRETRHKEFREHHIQKISSLSVNKDQKLMSY